MDLISVIVPIYNVEKYLQKCVESIVNQTYRNIEIILVDDGSPDKCPQMCDEWSGEDERIIVVHKKNGGLSSARNAGIEVMKGKYVSFIDSDDYIELNMLEIMHNAITKDDFDICICDTKHVDGDYNVVSVGTYQNSQYYGSDVLESFLEGRSYDPFSACDKLYKTSVIKKYHLTFDETNKWGEDFPFNYLYFKKINKLISVEDCLYNYLKIRDGSITNGVSAGKINRWKNNYKSIAQKEKGNPKIYKIALRKYVLELMCCCRELLRSGNDKLIDACYPSMVEEIKENFHEFISLKELSKPVRLSILLIRMNSNLFKCFYKLYKKQ